MFCDVSVTEWSDSSNTSAYSLPEIVDCVTSLACLVEGAVLLCIASPYVFFQTLGLLPSEEFLTDSIGIIHANQKQSTMTESHL